MQAARLHTARTQHGINGMYAMWTPNTYTTAAASLNVMIVHTKMICEDSDFKKGEDVIVPSGTTLFFF